MILLRTGFVAIALLLSQAVTVYADTTSDAWEALQGGDYATAERLMKPLADGGAAWAQVNLGLMYAQGEGVAQDYAEATKWFRMAARQGDPTAQHSLGMIHEEGHGLTQDYKKAARWYRLAAEQGHAWAQFTLGQMHAGGRGVLKDDVQAYVWFSLAAEFGHGEAVGIRNDAAENLTPAQLEEAQRRVVKWKTERGF